ncbi:MAG: protealysin inhibitor emfourin [Polymorphobacter sp.]
MSDIVIERIGGLAGFGLAGARVESKGEVASSGLSAATRARVDVLFATYGKGRAAPVKGADGFSYKISRTKVNGVEVITVPEAEVPAELRDCVTDRLK